MNTEPLTPEERALAQRLAQLRPHGEPSPALDAHILAAAHAATAAAPARKPRPRWPVALGIAASLALAVGIAWQLRPLPEAVVYDEAASATAAQAEMSAPAEAANDTAADSAFEQPMPRLQAPPPPKPAEMRRERSVAQRAPASAPGGAAAKAEPQAFPQSVAPAPAEPAVVFDEPMPVEAAPVPPAPPPPAATATSRAAAAPAAVSESRAQGYAQKNVASDPALDTFEADEEVVPPATADSPQVREAWLQRIRELMQTGKTDEARASLREFRHRYPAHPLPDDLRALAE